jgi:hypothetical protein
MSKAGPSGPTSSDHGQAVARAADRPRPDHGAGWIALHFLALSALVIAQPIYSVYQANPEIFVARSTPPLALVILAAAIAIVPPGILLGIVLLAGWIRPSWRMYVASFLVGVLSLVLVLQIGARFEGLHTSVLIGFGVLAGTVAAVFYFRRPVAGRYLSVLSPAGLVLAALFLLTPPMVALAVPRSVAGTGVVLSSDAPVVFIVFDELPEVSLLDSELEIDRVRYPNFAKLADDATWFRNAAPAHPYTTRSIPSLLSGELPDPSRLSTAADFPNNIFTLFAPTHDLHVVEPLTDLCPESLCQSEAIPVWEEAKEMSRITSQVYQRIVAPALFDDDVLQIEDPFERGDRIDAAMRADRMQDFRSFIDEIDGDEGQFYFAHFLLPHGPFHLLPSGASYNRTSVSDPGLDESAVWSGDPWHTVDNQQRHLLQVAAVDRLIGELTNHLREVDAYDKTMIVVTSDHGVAHIPGEPRRGISDANLYDIGAVPLIIKEPNQVEGVVDDRLIQAVDVIPTIAEILGANPAWESDGLSLASGGGRSELQMRDQEDDDVVIDLEGPGRAEAVERLVDRFGEGREEYDLFAYGPFADLVGSSVESIPAGKETLDANIDEPLLYSFVEPSSGFVPAFISGDLQHLNRLPTEPQIALLVNGVIGGVVPLHALDGNSAEFGGVVPGSLFRDGSNPISLLSVYSMDGETVANQVSTNIAPSYRFVEGQEDILESSSGDRIAIDPDAVVGFIDSAVANDGRRLITGWAFERETMEPVQSVAVFVGDQFVVSLVPNAERAGLAEQVGTQRVLMSGFAVPIPEAALGNDLSSLTAYGVTATGASELRIVEAVREQLGA